ncbi:MAG: helix-turn-helix domain-containing protein [Bacteroidetes bacterium]|nr:helix-turn-helix domain-containing protein [Bacteroidota bacterium]
MKKQKNKKQKTSTLNEVKDNEIWESNKMSRLNEFVLSESKKQSPERKLRNELLAIKFQIEDYIEKDKIDSEMRILDFVKLYLKLLKLSQKQLASIFEMKDTNLYKYLIGERKLNQDLVFKLSSFSQTPPELWYHVQTKNELHELRKGKGQLKKYDKYHYKNFVVAK